MSVKLYPTRTLLSITSQIMLTPTFLDIKECLEDVADALPDDVVDNLTLEGLFIECGKYVLQQHPDLEALEVELKWVKPEDIQDWLNANVIGSRELVV